MNTYFEKAGLYSGQLNEKLFSEKISLYDCNYDPRLGQIRFFDGEGSVRKNQNYDLIRDGKLVGLLSDLRLAMKYGVSTSANGQRSYNSGVNVQSNSLRFAPGTRSCHEILKSLDRCLVAVVAAGGDSNDLGEFSSPVQIGYLFEKGELKGIAPQVTVKTSVANYLGKDLIEVASTGYYRDSASPALFAELDVMI